jgi:hypothetical protein
LALDDLTARPGAGGVVPVVFTRGLPGQPSQDNKFMVTQTLVHDANGWHIASIISIANTQPK